MTLQAFGFLQNAYIKRGRKDIKMNNMKNRIIAGALVAVLAAGTVFATVSILISVFGK